MIQYDDDFFNEIERNLLPSNVHFSVQQKNVIFNSDTANVIAGPGSGKTTVLIAKCALLLSEENQCNDKGICVITHTNIAVDEILSGLHKVGIKEVGYPNFIGTIQEFIIQYFSKKSFHLFSENQEMIVLDGEEYFQKFNEVFSYLKPRWYKWDAPRPEYKSPQITFKPNFKFDITSDAPPSYKDAFNSSIQTLLRLGYINNSQCLEFANWYINNYQDSIIEALKNRFRFILLDEAQDTSDDQLTILNEIFLDNIPFQRFGDPYQALYTIFGEKKDAWLPSIEKVEKIEITETVRFSEEIAKHVRNVALEKYDAFTSTSINESHSPYFILYNSEEDLIRKYDELIKFISDKDRSYNTSQNKDSIISLKHDDLKAIFKHYEKNNVDISISQSLITKLYKFIIKTFAYETDISLRESEEMLREDYKTRINIALGIKQAFSQNNVDFLISQIESLCEKEISNFKDKKIKKKLEIMFSNTSVAANIPDSVPSTSKRGVYIGTIHSVKGETHRSTLLLLNTQLDNHIFDILKPYLIGEYQSLDKIEKDLINDTIKFLKLAYVAFSRPTHLLAIGIEESMLSPEYKEKLIAYGWVEKE